MFVGRAVILIRVSDRHQEPEATDDGRGSDYDDAVRGPHLWLNWQGMLAGQPARTSSEGQSILVHPLWEEHALYSDADISGEFEVGPYKLLSTLSSSRRLGRSAQALVLRHADHLYEAPVTPIEEELDVRGWTGGNLGDQMAALLALALGRRVRSGGVVRQGFEPGDPLGRPTAATHRAPTLVEPTLASRCFRASLRRFRCRRVSSSSRLTLV